MTNRIEHPVLGRWFRIGDPTWDIKDPPSEIRPPAWLDSARCDRGGLVLRRHGLFTSAVLRSYALPLSYLSPVGVKPLIQSNQLVDHAGPRLYRTANYVIGSQQAGAMHPGGPHWRVAAVVRTQHERVRRMLLRSGWDERHGAPIPQPDLAATALLFGPMTVEGLRRLGATITRAEADDVAHLARVMAYGQGVLAELQADDHAAAIALFEQLTQANGPPSRDGRVLMTALLNVPLTLGKTPVDQVIARPLRRFHRTLAVHLLGPENSRALGLRASGRPRRVLANIAWSPLVHARLAILHDTAVQWMMERAKARM